MSEQNLISEDHPWIDYKFDASQLSYQTWMQLGECTSKCEHIAQTPLAPNLREHLHQVYLSKGVHATTAIEGNTLSEEQVLEAVESKLELPQSKEYLKTEVDNIIKAVNSIGQHVADNNESTITPELLCQYNDSVLTGLGVEEGVSPGHFRTYMVGVARYRAPRPQLVPRLMEKLCEKLSEFDKETSLDPKTQAILKAVFSHLYVAWIHPFGDGNGRTARLLEFDILLRSGVLSAAAHLLSNHYNATRAEYYRRLNAASQARDAKGFVAYAITGFRDGLQEQLHSVNGFVRKSAWINYVHEKFSGEKQSDPTHRLRDVVLAMTHRGEPVLQAEFPLLSQKVNAYYKQKTSKTITRDINKLMKLQLIRIQETEAGSAYVANIELMDAFLPLQRDIDPD